MPCVVELGGIDQSRCPSPSALVKHWKRCRSGGTAHICHRDQEDCKVCSLWLWSMLTKWAPLTATPWSGSVATPAMHTMGQAASRTCRISANYIAGVGFVSMQDKLTKVLFIKIGSLCGFATASSFNVCWIAQEFVWSSLYKFLSIHRWAASPLNTAIKSWKAGMLETEAAVYCMPGLCPFCRRVHRRKFLFGCAAAVAASIYFVLHASTFRVKWTC